MIWFVALLVGLGIVVEVTKKSRGQALPPQDTWPKPTPHQIAQATAKAAKVNHSPTGLMTLGPNDIQAAAIRIFGLIPKMSRQMFGDQNMRERQTTAIIQLRALPSHEDRVGVILQAKVLGADPTLADEALQMSEM